MRLILERTNRGTLKSDVRIFLGEEVVLASARSILTLYAHHVQPVGWIVLVRLNPATPRQVVRRDVQMLETRGSGAPPTEAAPSFHEIQPSRPLPPGPIVRTTRKTCRVARWARAAEWPSCEPHRDNAPERVGTA
jgi:hypothetical protein